VSEIRAAAESDLEEIWRVQSACPEAATWNAAQYLAHDCKVALVANRVVGFVVARRTAPDELEILNLAVEPPYRRRGVARGLIRCLLDDFRGTAFLEVRQSNVAARKLYHSLGFEAVGIRPDYYRAPVESAIVMKFHSC